MFTECMKERWSWSLAADTALYGLYTMLARRCGEVVLGSLEADGGLDRRHHRPGLLVGLLRGIS